MAVNQHTQMLSELGRARGTGRFPRVLLHSCCAPCSARALTLLRDVCALTVYYYNPNIFPEDEYALRFSEQRRLITEPPFAGVDIIAPQYDHAEFINAVRGFEDEAEGGERCRRCFELRLNQTARAAAKLGFDYFATTLTVSPRKNADVINAVGFEAAERFPGVTYLASDMKKQDGYLESIRLSEKYGLYRQNYCGCPASRVFNARRAGS